MPARKHTRAHRENVAALPLDQRNLHELDYQDVAISREGVRLVRKAAGMVMDRYMPGGDSSRLTVAQAVAMFVDHVFWDERTGGLILCMDMDSRLLCLPIPRAHWNVRHCEGPLQ
jgi:ABC-type polar amino acid transport system ATPase subunit